MKTNLLKTLSSHAGVLKATVVGLCLMMTGSAWAEDVTKTYTSSKDLSVRISYKSNTTPTWQFETKNYYQAALLHLNNTNSASDLGTVDPKSIFTSMIGFDLTEINNLKKHGYTVSSAKVVITDHGNALNTVSLYNFSPTWSETKSDNKWSYQQISGCTQLSDVSTDKDAIYKALNGATALCSGKLVNKYKKAMFEVGTTTEGSGSTTQVFNVSDFQTDLTSDALKTLISENTTGSVSFALKTDNKAESTIFSKEGTAAGYTLPDNSAPTTTEYTWNGSSWAQGSETVTRYSMLLKYFNMTEAQFSAAVAPKLVVTLTPPDAIVNTSKTPTKAYIDLKTAVEEASANDVLKVFLDQNCTEQISVGNSITIQGNVGDEKIAYNTEDACFSVPIGVTLTLENIKITNESTGYAAKLAGVENSKTAKVAIKNAYGLANGLYLGKDARLDVSGATVSTENKIKLTFDSKYQDAWVCIQNCSNTAPFEVSTGKLLYQSKFTGKGEISATNTTYTLKVSSAGAATLCLPFDATIPTTKKDGSAANINVYTLKYTSGDKATATQQTGTLDKNTPVYVVADEGEYSFALADNGTTGSVEDPTSGALHGIYARDQSFTYADATPYYVLSQETVSSESVVGFFKAKNTNVSPFRAYMKAESGSNPAKINIDFGDATAINDVGANTSLRQAQDKLSLVQAQTKFLRNGKYVIIKNGAEYNAAGVRIK